MCREISRRGTLRLFAAGVAAPVISTRLFGDEAPSNPWSKDEVMEPAALASVLKSSAAPPNIICVTFGVLYRQRHILHAKYAGPTSKPEGLKAFKDAAQKMSRRDEIVIYCGCCPMTKCPNIRPAYQALKEMGFTRIRVLDMPTNFHTDWASKGYPVES